ncbi:hypothetical protein FRB94_006553 [Tulasnella sp. JGI-2019a]|nr:hypothetical protein FRB94_006553 [Tulasnella sp. JGI-2019a]
MLCADVEWDDWMVILAQGQNNIKLIFVWTPISFAFRSAIGRLRLTFASGDLLPEVLSVNGHLESPTALLGPLGMLSPTNPPPAEPFVSNGSLYPCPACCEVPGNGYCCISTCMPRKQNHNIYCHDPRFAPSRTSSHSIPTSFTLTIHDRSFFST